MVNYPLKIRWRNGSTALNKFVTRELEPLSGTPNEQREIANEELETIAKCVVDRQKSNIVIENEREHRLVLERLEIFANGIGNPGHGGKWATTTLHQAVKSRIQQLRSELENDD